MSKNRKWSESYVSCGFTKVTRNGSDCVQLSSLLGWLVGRFTPPLPWNGGMAQTAIQVHAINLIKLG